MEKGTRMRKIANKWNVNMPFCTIFNSDMSPRAHILSIWIDDGWFNWFHCVLSNTYVMCNKRRDIYRSYYHRPKYFYSLLAYEVCFITAIDRKRSISRDHAYHTYIIHTLFKVLRSMVFTEKPQYFYRFILPPWTKKPRNKGWKKCNKYKKNAETIFFKMFWIFKFYLNY